MPTITLPNGQPLSYVEAGHGGVPLLLLHGYPLDRQLWAPQLEGLRGHRVIAPDLRGFGESAAAAAPRTLAEHADDMAALLDTLGIPQVVLGGLSMGGYIALEFAHRHRGRLLGLVLADTKAEPDDAAARAGRDVAIATAERDGAAVIATGMGAKLFAAATPPAIREPVMARMAATSVAGITAALAALRDRADHRALLPTLAGLPVLVLVGAEDVLTPPAVARGMAHAVPGAMLLEIAGAGHLPTLEQPVVVTAALQRFLDALTPPG